MSKLGLPSCSTHDDPMCLHEANSKLPCASECSTQSCLPSVFDSVISTTHYATEDCEVVMYTMMLGYDVVEMDLQTEFSDGEQQEEWKETTVCTIAFVPSESALVRNIIAQVPPKELLKRGVKERDSHERKVRHLNGYLAHRGWLLIMVDDAVGPLTPEDMFLPKLSPARLFHGTVRKAMFLDEQFGHMPYPEDAQFLAPETSRGALKKRTVKGKDAKGQQTKYKLPPEPQRRAVLLVSPMRHIPDEPGHKMPLREITLQLMKDLGTDLEDGREPPEIKLQWLFYERARAHVNSLDMRALNPVSRHRLEIKDFIRSRWVVHHLKLKEGHQFRCEWYREHVGWGTHLDELSFAYVMGRRELVRKILTRQQLPPEGNPERLTVLQQVIKKMSDAHEWHPILSAEGVADALHFSQISPEAIPLNLQDLPGNEVTNVDPDAAFEEESTYYVRIMSEERMLAARKMWIKARK